MTRIHATRLAFEDLRVDVYRLVEREWIGHRVMERLDRFARQLDEINHRKRRPNGLSI